MEGSLPEGLHTQLGLKEGSFVKIVQRGGYVILVSIRSLMELFVYAEELVSWPIRSSRGLQ